ncbi:protein LEAD-SENSITIVE 1 isoform X1 [Gossypium hirsutum]|uniref:Protein LEAD-SENSITIVE 1 isoform X1 n=1 Tax=Gossypium hirsutum TaxID=3635 RepID=A0ABM2ZGU4_GOSHI|nr:protein LEAD-SENSITIVE 1 isoform X1 [Gossypium hirsutum]
MVLFLTFVGICAQFTERVSQLMEMQKGIYVGKAKVKNPRTGKEEQIENAVIHFLGLDKNGKAKTYRPQCPKCFHESHELGVVLTCLDCFYDGNTIYRYEYEVSLLSFTFKSSGSCSTFTSSEPDVVIKRAYSFLHKNNFGEYSFFFNNCEHFATKCKTGTALCNQILFGTGVPGAIAYNVARGFTKGLFWS